jgi:Flp pilus assembly protein TadG
VVQVSRRIFLKDNRGVVVAIQRIAHNTKGVVAIEAAIILPIFTLLVLGGLDMGLAQLDAS